MKIDEKFQAAKGKLNAIRDLYGTGNIELDMLLDEAEGQLQGLSGAAKDMVLDQVSGSKLATAAQCLGFQLPIPDIDGMFGKVMDMVACLGNGDFFDPFNAFLDGLMAGLPIADVMAKLQDLKSLAGIKLQVLGDIQGLLAEFSHLQGLMTDALGTVGTLVGCTDGITGAKLGRHFQAADTIMAEVNSNFKQGLDAVKEAESFLSDPADILKDAKARVTAKLDLDGQMSDLKDRFSSSFEGLL